MTSISLPPVSVLSPARYYIEYSPSSSVKCKGDQCGGDAILEGTLRFGMSPCGNSREMAWRHWDCLTPEIVKEAKALGRFTISSFDGFHDLTRADRQMVTKIWVEYGHLKDKETRTGSSVSNKDLKSETTAEAQTISKKVWCVFVELYSRFSDVRMKKGITITVHLHVGLGSDE
ncbi:hypothetical protein HGRIS_011858 [Hohenbuehelia grisea]|uniref:PARP-type domain-containing protein n=1 Tax=Hohenbuehelia grisea TaxID=104357 RepID=A0ABR3JX62_9AGAR